MEKKVTETKKKSWQLPHTFLVIGMILVLATVMTWLIPAGVFERVLDPVSGRNLVVPGSFSTVPQNPVGPFGMFMSILDGLVGAANVIWFTMISYGFMCMMIHVGAFNSGMGALIRVMKGKEKFLLPILIIAFGLMGAACGLYEEAYGFIPVMMSLSMALGYDALTGAVIVMGSVGIGYASAFVNPYTLAVAQSIAELPLFSGIGFRIICFVVFITAYIIFAMRYANRVKKDPTKSYVYGDSFEHLSVGASRDELMNTKMTSAHRLSLLVFLATIIIFVYGALQFGWYFSELSAVYIISMFIIGFINKLTPSEVCSKAVEIYKEILFACLVIGIARAILVVMQNGEIVDSVCYYMSNLLIGLPKTVAAVAMMFFQTLLNFFVPSGSGQAATSMPIMIPLADLIGMNRQIAVLAFQFGDGFSNLFWPTMTSISCAIAGCKLNKWYKFFGPLFGILLVLECIMMVIAVMINYGPF
ncbi:MAG: TIGR00366 family protein [Eubacterium sp.]